MAKKTTKKKIVTPKEAPVGPTIGEVLLCVGNLEGRVEILETRLAKLVDALKGSKGLKGI